MRTNAVQTLVRSARQFIPMLAHLSSVLSDNWEAAAKFVKMLKLTMPILMLNESGASIDSASEVAREKFPNHDVTVKQRWD